MPDKFHTDGKVTYLPGCAPRFEATIQSMAEHQRITQAQLEAAEQDISQHAYEFPPEGLRVKPDEPSIPIYFDGEQVITEHVYGDPYGFAEADELDIWAPDHSAATPDHVPSGRLSVFLLVAIPIVMLLLVALLAALIIPIPFATFSPAP